MLGLFIARSARGALSVLKNPIGKAKLLSGESSSEVISLLAEVTRARGPPYVPLSIPFLGCPMAFSTASASFWVASIDIEVLLACAYK